MTESSFSKNTAAAKKLFGTAAKLAQKQAELATLNNVTLPKLYHAIGKRIVGLENLPAELEHHRQRIRQLEAGITATPEEIKSDPAGGFVAKAKQFAQQAAQKATKATGDAAAKMKIQAAYVAMGRQAVEKVGEKLVPTDIQTPLSEAKHVRASLEDDIRHLQQASRGVLPSLPRLGLRGAVLLVAGITVALTMANVIVRPVFPRASATAEDAAPVTPTAPRSPRAARVGGASQWSEQQRQELTQEGDASHAGNALAVLNRLAIEDADQFKGTELAAAAEAYRKGEETYAFDGKTVNLMKIAGDKGVAGVFAVAQRSGASVDQIDATFEDREGTKEYLKSGYAFGAQKYQMQRLISEAGNYKLNAKASSAEFAAKFKPAGMSDDDFITQTKGLTAGFNYALTDIVVNETANMTVDERAATMERRGKEELQKYFRSSAGGKLSEAAAEKRSKEYFNEFYGDTPEKRKGAMNTAYRQMNAVSNERTGLSVDEQQKMRTQSGR